MSRFLVGKLLKKQVKSLKRRSLRLSCALYAKKNLTCLWPLCHACTHSARDVFKPGKRKAMIALLAGAKFK